MTFLKRVDLSGFPGNSFLFSVDMGDFGDILFQKWRDLPEKSKLSLQISKSLPQI